MDPRKLYNLSKPWQPEFGRDNPWADKLHLASFEDQLTIVRPARIRFVAAKAIGTRREPEGILRLTAVGVARVPYSIVEALASTLARTVVATGIVPMIRPIIRRDIERLDDDLPSVRRLFLESFCIFDADGEDRTPERKRRP